MKQEHNDLPRAEAIKIADQLRAKGWDVFFKFSCQHCGERCVLEEANTIYENGECCICGEVTKLDKVGFMLVYSNNTANTNPEMN